MKFIFFGHPFAKTRPRYSKSTGQCYDIQAKEKKYIKKVMEKQIEYFFASLEPQEMLESQKFMTSDGYSVQITFFFPIPNSWKESKKNLALWGRLNHTSKPDLDNLEKFYLDAASLIIWKDDAEVVMLQSKKIYSDVPRTEMEIKPMNPTTPEKVKDILGCINPSEVTDLVAGFSRTIEEFEEGNAQKCSEILEKIAVNYSHKLQKIVKIHKKWLTAEQNLCKSERAILSNEDEDNDENLL